MTHSVNQLLQPNINSKRCSHPVSLLWVHITGIFISQRSKHIPCCLNVTCKRSKCKHTPTEQTGLFIRSHTQATYTNDQWCVMPVCLHTIFLCNPRTEGKQEHAVNNSRPSKWFDFMAVFSLPLCLRNVATADNVKFGRLVPQNLAESHYCVKNTVKPLLNAGSVVWNERSTGFYHSKWWKKVFDCLYVGTLGGILMNLLTEKDTVWWWRLSEKWATRCDRWCNPLWWHQRILPANKRSVTLPEK